MLSNSFNKKFTVVLLSLTFFSVIECQDVRYCVTSNEEESKCTALSAEIKKSEKDLNLVCVRGHEVFDCMKLVKNNQADLVNVDAGLGWYGSQKFSLRPVAIENYGSSNEEQQLDLNYYSNIIVPSSLANLSPYDLKSKQLCFSGAGTAEGWILPLSKLLDEMQAIPVKQCNSVVQNLIDFLGNSCVPGALNEIFNPFGDNTEEVCKLCNDAGLKSYCTLSDKFAYSQGALKCLQQRDNSSTPDKVPVGALVRAQEIDLAAKDGFQIENYLLLCPDKQQNGLFTADITQWKTCHWGKVPARMIMTGFGRLDVQPFRKLFEVINRAFGVQPDALSRVASSAFNPFSSSGYSANQKDSNYNLMFSEFTRTIYLPEESSVSSYYQWINNYPEFLKSIKSLNQCPLPTLRWCVLDRWEMEKCQTMQNAFSAKGIKPEVTCILGNKTTTCMKLIRDGYVDLMSVDAAELYSAGKYFGLVPFAAEYYGTGPSYYAVAVVHKQNPNLLISNWKYGRVCHSGVGKATGWVIPINTVIDTVQIRVIDNRLIYAYGELISRACIPGILDSDFNADNTNSINLCEMCVGGGIDKCQRNNRELYYGDAGAFRCLTQSGDVAFMRHTTVHSNTAGRCVQLRKSFGTTAVSFQVTLLTLLQTAIFVLSEEGNPNYWARNLREDDYELLCPNGHRMNTNEWRKCHLAKIPGNVIITADFKTVNERKNMWRMLQYGQEYYSSDFNHVFAMFDSGFDQTDLMFSDDTESLQWIKEEDQSYRGWLDSQFIRLIENLEVVAGQTPSGLYNSSTRNSFTYLLLLLNTLILTYVML